MGDGEGPSSKPPDEQCTGDAYEYGQSGLGINMGIPNTDPRASPFNFLEGTRAVYYDGPGQTALDAALRAEQALTPLLAIAGPFAAAPL